MTSPSDNPQDAHVDPAQGTSGTAPRSVQPMVLGDFEIEHEIGRGGMGTVFKARQRSLNREVALKVLHSQIGASPSAVQRFLREAEAAARLHHTHIIPIFARGEADGVYFYAMELIEGVDLHSIIENRRRQAGVPDIDPDETVLMRRSDGRDGPDTGAAPPTAGGEHATDGRDGLSVGDSAVALSKPQGTGKITEEIASIARHIASIADALDYAHAEGVVHRDIKPHNLILGSDGRLHISDFGLARVAEQPGVTTTGEMLGSPLYMSPEQIIEGPSKVNHRTDIYSLGATMFEWLTLQPPYPGETRERVITRIVHFEAPTPRSLNPDIPFALETICMKAIERDPEKRYQTAGELRDDLNRFLLSQPILARRASLPTRIGRWVSRHPVGSLSVVAALVAVSLSWALYTSKTEIQAKTAEVEQAAAAAQKATAAMEQTQADHQDLIDRLEGVLPPELTGPLRLGAAAVEGIADEGSGSSNFGGLLDETGPEPANVGSPIGIIKRAALDLHAATAPADWPGGNDVCSRRFLGSIDAATSEPVAARRAVDNCLRVQPDQFDALQLRAVLCSRMGQFDTMVRDAIKLVQLRANDPRSHLWLGLAQMLLGQSKFALESLDRAVAIDRSTPWGYALRGLEWLRVGQSAYAMMDLNAALDREGDLAVARLARCAAYAATGKLEPAIEDLSYVLMQEPENADALALRGDYYVRLGRYKEAVDDYDLAMKIGGKSPAMLGRYIPAQWQLQNANRQPDTPSEVPAEAPAQVGPETTEPTDTDPPNAVLEWFSRYVWPRSRDSSGSDAKSPGTRLGRPGVRIPWGARLRW